MEGGTRSAGIVALLFTDLVGSTELLDRLGDDAAEEVRRAHFSMLRAAVTAAGGEEVKSLGDGLMVAFASPVAAVGCAVGMQRAVEAHNQTAPGPGLGLRVGIQVGDPPREGEDFFGTAVVVAKRLCDTAQGGQILASELVAGLLGTRGGFRFRPVGRLSLKGLAQALPAVAVEWQETAGARESTAARRGGDGRTGHAAGLPVRLGPALTGRNGELAILERELERATRGELRCVLLTGEPGVGKTRLAAELIGRHPEVTTLSARAHHLSGTAAFGLWVEALERHLRSLQGDQVGRLCGGFLDDLASVLRSVAALRVPPRSTSRPGRGCSRDWRCWRGIWPPAPP